MSLLLDKLRFFFQSYRRTEITDSRLTRAGVLVVLFEKADEPYFLLTRRTQDVEHHKGQISFPGGTVDENDRDITHTAVRETEEEIGLTSDNIEIAGILSDITIPTGFVVTPVVGFIRTLPTLNLNAAEVDSVLEVPLGFFLEPGNKRIVKMMRGGKLHDVYFFSFGDHEIWGATAAIINSFLAGFAAPS